jgi:hypothetical protein
MLGITVRTLDRWHRNQYGLKRLHAHPIRYSRTGVQAWVANYGRGSERPRSQLPPGAINCTKQTRTAAHTSDHYRSR